MTAPIFKGSKGGGSASFKQTPDNLRSDDTFEGVLGVCIGPVKGPKRGLKSIKVNGTAIENETGEPNLGDFTAIVGNGDPTLFPQLLKLKLGAGAAPTSVGLQLQNSPAAGGNPWVTKTLLNTGADHIDLRFLVNQLYQQTDKGIFNHTATLDIQMKPTGSTNWIDPTLGTPSDAYQEAGFTVAPGQVAYVMRSIFADDGTFPEIGEANLGGRVSSTGFAITGKTISPAVYELRIAVPNEGPYANVSWDVRVRLLELESVESSDGKNVEKRNITWESLAGVYGTELGAHEDWRGVAWMQVYGKASEALTGVPEMTGEWDTKIVSVPPSTVFNPDTRTYTGAIWDGSWAKAFTNDPAWVINDAITDSLSGLSLIAQGSYLNKWDALEASKWCSEQVPDGAGGTEPRYSLNLSISDPMKAEDFIRYLAGAVGGLAWDQGDGEWRLKMDKPEQATDIFTLDNILGEFSYTHTDVDTRFNDITMAFKNKEMDYREDRVRLFNNDHIAKYGRKPTTMVAVGCTGRQEAMRRTELRLQTTTGETKLVQFTTNRRGRNLDSLNTILVADGDLGDRENRSTGRAILIAPDRMSLTLRDAVRLEVGVAYALNFASPNPNYNADGASTDATRRSPTIAQTRGITNTAGQRGNVTTLYLDAPLPADVDPNLSISLSAPGLPTLPKLYRVMSVTVGEGESAEFISINALEVNTGKWDAADNVTNEATVYQDLRGEVLPPVEPIGGVLDLIRTAGTGGSDVVTLMGNFERPPSSFISGFRVDYSVNGGNLNSLIERTQQPTFELVNPAPGDYRFEIRTIDRRGKVSLPLVATITVTQAMIDAATIVYHDGTPVDDLKPAEAGANVTGTHMAADFENRGALATKNQIDLATADAINKSLANIDAAANTKLAGVQALADVTATHMAADFANRGALATQNFTYFDGGYLKEPLVGGGYQDATLANFKTIQGTSADFINRGALATLNAVDMMTTQIINKSLANLDGTANTKLTGIAAGATVGARSGTNLYRTDGTTVMTQAEVRTIEGMSADFSNRGALATLNAVDLSTTQVTNKSLANVDATANTKLTGIAAGATVGSRAGTNLYRTDGTTVMTQADVRTIEGTSADFINRGALATKNVADWTTDLANVPTSQIFSRNMIDTAAWKGGNSLPASPGNLGGVFGNPGSVVGPIANEAGPLGKVMPVMTFTSNASGYGYGFGGSAFPTTSGFDPKKSYRFRVWTWRSAGVGIFVGPGLGGTMVPVNIRRPGASTYWTNAQDGGYIPPNNTWVLFVGIIHGSDYTGGDTGQTGFYDTTGRKLGSSSLDGDFKFATTGTLTSLGATVMCYDNGVSGLIFKYADPVIEDMASAPTISSLMATYGAVAGTSLYRTDGTTVLTQAEVRTVEGVAADYSGRGALANLNAVDMATTQITNKSLANLDSTANTKLGGIATGATVGARSGTNIFRTDGTTVMTQAEIRTIEGVSADFTNRGALATLNAVDLAGSTVINKSLANVDATANTKLAGIASGASNDLRLTLIGTVQPTINGNQIISSSGLYAGHVRSDAMPGPCFAEADIVAGDHVVLQLDTEAADSVYTSQQLHCSYRQSDGSYGIYRNGTMVVDSITTAGLTGKLRAAYDGYRYRVWIAGTEIQPSNSAMIASGPGLTHYAKWAPYGANILYTGLRCGPFTDNAATSLYYSTGSSVAAKEPAEAGANITATHTAADFTNRGALATLNAADFATQVTGSTKPAANADVTLASQLVVTPSPDLQINFTSAGAVAANQLPLTRAAPLVTKGGVSITGVDNLLTYSLSNVSAALGTVTVDNTSGSSTKGSVTLANTPTALTGAGSYTLTVSYNGTVISIMRVGVTIIQASQAQGGASGGSTGTIGDTVSNSYVQVGQTIVGVSVSGGKSLRCAYGGNYQVGGFNHSARASVKFRYAPTGTTTYTDIGTPAQGSYSSRGSQQSFDMNSGSVNYAQNATPATGTYDVSMWATSDSWNITFDGFSEGSVTVS